MESGISIVISAFNEEESLNNFGKSLVTALSEIPNRNFEIIWVNDGSTDHTSAQITAVSKKYQASNVRHVQIDFSKNFGHEAAMIAGIDNATGKAVICMDADGQHPPSEIAGMIGKFEEGNDFVLMNRIQRDDNGFIKKAMSALFYKVINYLSEIPFQNNASDFFLISENIAAILRESYREKNRFIRGFIQSLGFDSASINYKAPKREAGESKYSFKKLFQLAISAVFTFSFKPLRLGVFFAFVFVVLTLILSAYSLYEYFYGNTPPSGYTSIILFISFSFALLFTIISIQLLYFEKVIDEVRQNPLYIIKSKRIHEEKD